jgi:hypothetical protein
MATTPESENPPHIAAPPAPPATATSSPAAAPESESKPKGAKSPKGAKADASADVSEPVSVAELMPEAHGRKDAAAIDLLFDACEKFNVNPSAQIRPRELASWRYYPAQALEDVPAAVVLVTAGGTKLKYFEADALKDPDTEERLRAIFRAWSIDPKTKERVPAPLPPDQTLPAEAVIGQVVAQAHRHQGGYLRRPRRA